MLLLCSITNIYSNTKVTALEELESPFNSIEFVDNIVKQLNGINVALEELALITNNSSTKLINKGELLESIKVHRELTSQIRENIRDLMGKMRDNPEVQAHPASLKLLLNLNTALIEHVRDALNKGFYEFPIFNIESIVHRNIGQVSHADLQEQFDATNKDLQKLSKEVQGVGLTWYNKAYRAVDGSVIQPFQKYNMGRYLKWGAILTAASVAIAWQYFDMFQDRLGEKPSYEINTGKLSNKDELRWLGRLNHFFWEHSKGVLPVNSWLYTTCIAASLPELASLKNYAGKKVDAGINYLKGGAYTNKKTEDLNKIIPKYNLDDLVGLDHVKEIFGLIVKYIEDPERFDRTKLTPEKGFLLTGPTRTGKTFSAEALAGEIRAMMKRNGRDPDEFNFFVLRASFIKEQGVRWIFNKAKEVAPCILFVDEIDLLQLQRGGGNLDLLSEFLTSMSGCLENNDPNKPVIVIGATNKPENLDVALRQRGRFGTELRYEYPSDKDRTDFFVQKLSSLSLDLADFNIDQLVRQTEKCSYEDLTAMIRAAFQRAKLRGETLTQAHLEESLDREIRNIMLNNEKELPAQEKTLLSVHQAGHALATILLDGKQKLAKVTIRPYQAQIREEAVWEQYYQSEEEKQKKIVYGKTFTYHEHDTVNFDSHDEKIKKCKMQLAGHAAEKIVLGSCGYSYHADDSQRAFEIAKSIAFGGIDINAFPDEIKAKYLEKALALKAQCETEITQLLEQHKDVLQKIAAALEKNQTLTLADIQQLMGLKPILPIVDLPDVSQELGLQEQQPEAAVAA